MSFPDPTPPPHPFISSPFVGGDAGGFWPPFWVGNEQQQQSDLMSQFDRPPPFKRPRTSENPPNYAPFPPMNPRINPPNVPGGGKGTSHIFYKTRMCAKFMEGTCRNGDHCTFAHGVEDLREPPPNWQDLIREKDRGSFISSSWGDDQRMIHRMKICKKYYNGEECPYGEKCNFLHERPSPPMKKFKIDMSEQRESSAISIGITGDGRGSISDFDQKVFWKTKLCSKWEMGQCPFGERCHYAHGHSELKFSGTLDEAELVMNAGSVPRKSAPVSAFSTAPANLAVGAPLNGDEEDKKTSKWKVTKKINRIYADWLDDLTPPYCSPSEEI
ncbi:hypothetical protein Pfo_003178 [Paulownia fortunei]|nr:hypothetical protein Pfo_003178 [Paulownia fortunei]